jgi:hypothetical protein
MEAQARIAAAALSAQDLITGSAVRHDIAVPEAILHPRADGAGAAGAAGLVRLRPLTVGALALISKAAREDPGLVPLLMIKEALVEPALALDQVRQLHVGLVHFLVGAINRISGLTAEGEAIDAALGSPLGSAHLLLARHFGWTPEQVSQLTPGQVMVYLAGIERLLRFDEARRSGGET